MLYYKSSAFFSILVSFVLWQHFKAVSDEVNKQNRNIWWVSISHYFCSFSLIYSFPIIAWLPIWILKNSCHSSWKKTVIMQPASKVSSQKEWTLVPTEVFSHPQNFSPLSFSDSADQTALHSVLCCIAQSDCVPSCVEKAPRFQGACQ